MLRMHEFKKFEIIISKNINVLNYFQKKSSNFFKGRSDISCSKLFNISFKIFFRINKLIWKIKFIKALEVKLLYNAYKQIVQFGWKKEAVPVVQKKSH